MKPTNEMTLDELKTHILEIAKEMDEADDAAVLQDYGGDFARDVLQYFERRDAAPEAEFRGNALIDHLCNAYALLTGAHPLRKALYDEIAVLHNMGFRTTRGKDRMPVDAPHKNASSRSMQD